MNQHLISPSFCKISIHKGASKALIPHQKIEDVPFWGRNGMADIDFWPHDIYPANENEIVYKKNAVELIHDLVTQVNSTNYCIKLKGTMMMMMNYSICFLFFSESKSNFAYLSWTVDKYFSSC